jgi:hypothetical protein
MNLVPRPPVADGILALSMLFPACLTMIPQAPRSGPDADCRDFSAHAQ